jgi:hypothetical protein
LGFVAFSKIPSDQKCLTQLLCLRLKFTFHNIPLEETLETFSYFITMVCDSDTMKLSSRIDGLERL